MERALDRNKTYRSAQGKPGYNTSNSPQNRRPRADHFFNNTRRRKDTFPVWLRLPLKPGVFLPSFSPGPGFVRGVLRQQA
jgi:hypothetical protein